MIGGKIIPAQSPPINGEGLEELHKIGGKIAQLVLAKNIEGILRYDRPDLVEEDRKLLNNRKSDLYCFLFDTSCITWQGKAVYDVLQNARQLRIKIDDWGQSEDGARSAMILFFDGAKINEQQLLSPDFLCGEGGKEVVTWTFKYVSGKWTSLHPLFDGETDVKCNPE